MPRYFVKVTRNAIMTRTVEVEAADADEAHDEGEARQLAFAHCPEGRWSFMYRNLEDIHPLDRKRHGFIGARREVHP